MAKDYGGRVTITFNSHGIECDGSLEDFAQNLFPSWDGEFIDVTGNIVLEYDDEQEDTEQE